jgi:methionyl-tRNA formyltransferase
MIDVIMLGVNRYGEEVYDWLVDRNDTNVLCMITDENQYSTIRRLNPDLMISAGFKYIVPNDVLQIPELGTVNLHHSYLPYNRGYNPDVWSIIEQTPAGVSIHYMTPEVDQGEIIDRREVETTPADTSKSLYERLEKHQVDIFKSNWEKIKNNSAESIKQDKYEAEGTFHYKQDFIELWEINENESVKVGAFIDRLRALTHPPYNNAYFKRDGEKYYIDIEITPESDISSEDIHWNISEYDENDK